MNLKSTKVAIMLLAIGFLLMLNGCKKSEPEASQGSAENMQQMQEHKGHEHEHEAMMAKPGMEMASAVEQKTCPVMGAPINKDLFTEYKGKKVYFCCEECKPKFEQEPEKYIAKLPQFNK